MNSAPFNTPILFLIFRQPDITLRVFERIRELKPKHLFVSADGPRANRKGEAEECEVTRSIISMIDWDCDLRTRFLPVNYGCKKAVSSAIDWFFLEVDEGIILEYDCLPDLSFFYFCRAMLDRYREDSRVFSITGNNFQRGVWRGDGDYYFSRITGVWGWATWRRAWCHWSGELREYDEFIKCNHIANLFASRAARNFWAGIFNGLRNGTNTTTWGYYWLYAQFCQSGLCVTPNRNLVANIGFGEHGTNARDPDDLSANLPCESLWEYREPSFQIPDLAADEVISLAAAYIPAMIRIKSWMVSILGAVLPLSAVSVVRRVKRWIV
ncbi:MAG: hypothetical protein JW384_03255 [Nitrosomonadaceae bacterium]|nr:hypothetical protein [Nitrosomonadaceae bacterium]